MILHTIISLLLITPQFGVAQDASAVSNRFIDVRKLIQDTLDAIRTYQAPEILVQPVLDGVNRQQTSQQQQRQTQLQQYYAYQQQHYHPPQQQQQQKRQHSQPQGREVGQEEPSGQFHQPRKLYSTNVVEVNGTSQVPAPAPLERLFVAPTRQDVERLLHLPADIVHRMAEDAGYIPPSQPTGLIYSSGPDDNAYDGYYKLKPAAEPKSNGVGGFDFNIQSPTTFEITTTTASKRIIYASGKPHVMMQSFYRDGKMIQIPVLSIPQADGTTIFIPYERLELISAATAEIVANGRLAVDPSTKVYDSAGALAGYSFERPTVSIDRPMTTSTKPPSTTLALPKMVIGSSINTASRVSDASRGDALATNRLPVDTFRKMFHVTDRVYPNIAMAAESQVSAAKDIVLGSGSISTIPATVKPSEKSINDGQPQILNKIADKRDRKRVIATESNAFLQEVDEDPSDDEIGPLKSQSVTSYSNSDNIVVLNGRRYQLVPEDKTVQENHVRHFTSDPVSVLSGSENNDSHKSSGTDILINDKTRPQLKSVSINEPAGGRPLPLVGLESVGLESFHVTQQTDMPSLPDKTQPFNVNPIQASYSQLVSNLLRQNFKIDALTMEQKKQQDRQKNQQQPQFPASTAFVQETSATIRPTIPQLQLQSEQHIRSHYDSENLQPVQLHQTLDERVVVVNGGAVRATPTAALSSDAPMLSSAIQRATSSTKVRRKQQNLSSEDSESNYKPARQYSLKELEEFYHPQHAAARLSSAAVEGSAERRLRTDRIRSIDQIAAVSVERPDHLSDSALKKLTRLEALRRQFAYERQQLTQRHKIHFVGARHTMQEQSYGNSPAHCEKIRALARQYGQLDVKGFARRNCAHIATQMTDTSFACHDIDQRLATCDFSIKLI